MALQISSYHSHTHSYNDLPHEMKLHIFSFLSLETLIDVVRYLDKFHRIIVTDILKKYILTNTDCNSFWFEHIKNQKTLFLHAHLKQQPHGMRVSVIDPITQQLTTITWLQYLSHILKLSIEKNSYLYIYILLKNFTNKNIRLSANLTTPQWYLSKITTLLIDHIKYAIKHNSNNIITFLFQNNYINFTFLEDDIEEQHFKFTIFCNFAVEAISHNRVNIFTLLTSLYNYSNDNYNTLLVICATNKTIDKAISEKKDHIMDLIFSRLITDHAITNHAITQFINNALQDKISNVNNILYFLNKMHNQLSIDNYKNILVKIISSDDIVCQNITTFVHIFTLYTQKYDTKDDLLSREYTSGTTNIDTLISNIKSSLIYQCFIISIKNDKSVIMLFLKDILLKNCLQYNLTQEQFVKYLILDCISQTKNDKAIRIIEDYKIHTHIYTLLFQDLPSIYNLENIISIMNIISVGSCKQNYENFLTLFLQKQIFTKQIYINLLKNNLYLSLKNNDFDANYLYSINDISSILTDYILLKLKQTGETNLLNNEQYTTIFINFIKNKKIKNIDFMLTNGYIINDNALITAIKIKSINIIKLLITNGANIAANNYSVLHFALKLPKITLAAFIKLKLISDNKEQLYSDWESNTEFKSKFIAIE